MQSKKGKTTTTQRELTVVMPNGQNILVKCEVKSRGVDVFDMIVAHSNLIEHFYFGIAYIDGEFKARVSFSDTSIELIREALFSSVLRQ